MAAQLGTVAYKLIAKAVSQDNNAQRRGSRMSKMRQLKTAIEGFHKHLEDTENRRQNDQDQVTFQNVLEESEKQQQRDENVKKWLDGVKDVYYKVIDVCEELRTEEVRAEEEGKGRRPLLYSIPLRQCPVRIQIRDGILQMICEILPRVEALQREKDNFKLDPKGRVFQGAPVEISVDKAAAAIYGRYREKKSILARMYHRWTQVQVVSIVGRTGVGKSALAQLVFDEARAVFDLAAWVNVPEEFGALRIAQDFVESVTSKKINKTELDNLNQRVRDIIREKRYLLVLDGVQDKVDFDSEWKKLTGFFDCGTPGCTILMTTRQEERVLAEISYSMPLAPLKDEHCWSIITDAAFGTPSNRMEVDTKTIYEEVGKKLVEKCKGLPVIAKAVGGVLRGRTLVKDWQQLLGSDIWESGREHKPDAVKATMLSYHILPSKLRQCLLYCSIFPRNHHIDVNKLINLWMAQDSIGLELDQEKMEDEGWKRFKQLLARSIFQEYSHQDDSGSFKCKLQGAMSDFIHDIAQNECPIIHLDKAESGKVHIPENARHCTLNVVLPQASLPASIVDPKNLHTLMLLSEYSFIDSAKLSTLLSRMPRLRALDMSYCSMKELPPKACELLHLRYLDLSFNRDLKKLPPAIRYLINLQTLNLNGCDDLQELPKGIGKLTKLRHLDILWTTNLSYLPKGLTSLTSLRRLSRFFGSNGYGGDNEACNLADLKHLKNLQGYITIEGLGGETSASEAGEAALPDKKDLLGLELWFSVLKSESNHESILEALKAPSGLQCLGIFYYKGSFKPLPPWMSELEKLTHLIIADCSNCHTLPPLGKLQYLESLELKNLAKVSKVGREFLGKIDEDSSPIKVPFPKLQKLQFEMLANWVEWEGNNDVKQPMPLLSSLSILGCPKMKELPNYILRKRKLKVERKDSMDGTKKANKAK